MNKRFCDDVGVPFYEVLNHMEKSNSYFYQQTQERMMKSLRALFVPLCLLACFLGTEEINGQDFHYSQFYHAPLHLNPALTGIFNGDGRLSANYKSQWADVPVDYKTFTVAYDKKFYNRTDRTAFFSGGLGLNYDRAGDSKLTWGGVNLNLSYTKMFSPRVFLSVGGQAGLAQRSFDPGNLRFDSQFDDPSGVVDLGLPTGENFGNDSHIFPDFALGINLRLQAKPTSNLVYRNNKRTKLDIGVGIHHLFTPDQSFIEDVTVPLERRLSPYASGTLQLGTPFDLVGAITYQTQSSAYEELVGMAGIRFHLSNKLGKQFNFLVGAGMRRNEIQDAWWPTVELGINNLEIGLNYDFNVSRFDVATENRGGLELSLRYLIRKVRPLPAFRSCTLL